MVLAWVAGQPWHHHVLGAHLMICNCILCPSQAGALLTLQGAGAYDAAVYCAAISAARRAADGTAHHGPNSPTGGKRHSHAALFSMDEMFQKARRFATPFNAAGKRLKSALCDMLHW